MAGPFGGKPMRSILRLTAGLFALLASAVPSFAQSPAANEFYAKRTIKLIVPYAPGGSYDLYARLVADHMPQYIPARPAIVVSHMPGAGGAIGVQALYTLEPQDGTSMAIMPRDIASNQMLRPETVKYDARRFAWIGSISAYAGVLYVHTRTGVKTLDDFRKKPVVIGSWGPTTESFITPTLLNAVAGTNIKIVTGYRGGPDVDIAAERGEVDGRVASWGFLKGQRPQWLKEGTVVVPFQTGLRRHPELPDVPLIPELALEASGRNVLEFMNADSGLGWSLASTPNVPAERLALLRGAFEKVVTDKAFLADAEKRNLDILPSSGSELDALVARTLATPPEAVAQLKKLIGE